MVTWTKCIGMGMAVVKFQFDPVYFDVERHEVSAREDDRALREKFKTVGCKIILGSMTDQLLHRTVYEDKSLISKELPFVEPLQALHPGGSFPLVEDPLITKKATLIGMFVLRPALATYNDSLLNEDGFPDSIYNDNLDWAYNVRGLDGGWIIANSNSVDAYRLALQYGVSDAVIAGSNAASIEGTASDHNGLGYLWQPYCLGEWEQLKSTDPNIATKIATQRIEWQRLGYLSTRKYAATIIFTWSGLSFEGQKDFLEARVFTERHPDGSPCEVYIMTSELGAANVRQRAAKFGLTAEAVAAMLIVVPPGQKYLSADSGVSASPSGKMVVVDRSRPLSAHMDLSLIPNILHDQYGMRIVNHDGGQTVLREFCRAGALSQMNITLCRNASQYQVVASNRRVPEARRGELLSTFAERIQYFFSRPVPVDGDTSAADGEDDSRAFKISRAVPRSLRPVCVISDTRDEVAVVTFNTKGGVDFHLE